MNSFEQVCEDCPVREQVDVTRAIERIVDDEPSVLELDDGFRQCSIMVRSNTSADTVPPQERAGELIDSVCKGAGRTALRRTCGVGFASAWKLERTQPIPNIAVPFDIIPLLTERASNSTRNGSAMAFDTVCLRKTLAPIIGLEGAVAQGRWVYLSVPSPTLPHEFNDIFVVGIGAGPSYAFSYDRSQPTDSDVYDAALAQGLFEFLHTDEQGLVRSQQKIEAMHAIFQTERKELQDFVLNGGLLRDLQRNDE